MNPSDYDVVFLATPAEASAELAPKILGQGVSVIDLSGAFRLAGSDSVALYKKWYGMDHPAVELVKTAHYGLVPWKKLTPGKGVLVANPGCYATAILMGVLPLLSSKIILEETLVIDAKSGTTGAGKKPVESQLFSEVDGECLPYKVGAHQHLPEITHYTHSLSGVSIDPFLTTSLLPTRRGIIAGIYAKLVQGKTLKDVEAAFREFYLEYPLVKVSSGVSKEMVSLKKVVGTGMTHLSFEVVGEKLYLFSCVDNLLKGAASQAIENFNLLFGFPVTAGLEELEAMI
jgi:N-acetyl-gamma-glutamyl-phosphate reductase